MRCGVDMSNNVLRAQLRVIDDPQVIEMGVHAKILHCAEDRQGLGRIDIWFQDEITPTFVRKSRFVVVGTGHPFPNGYEHIQTIVMKNQLVWHVFRVIDHREPVQMIPD